MKGLADKARFNLTKAVILLLQPRAPGPDIATQILAGFGVRRPYICDTVERGMALAKGVEFDLVICDAGLPDGIAYDFITQLRKSSFEPNRFCPVIVLAGHTPIAQVAKARDCGANFVVTKPLISPVLLERIIWISQETRPFIELDTYAGPDRRFQNLEMAPGSGRRREDPPADVAAAPNPSPSNAAETPS